MSKKPCEKLVKKITKWLTDRAFHNKIMIGLWRLSICSMSKHRQECGMDEAGYWKQCLWLMKGCKQGMEIAVCSLIVP